MHRQPYMLQQFTPPTIILGFRAFCFYKFVGSILKLDPEIDFMIRNESQLTIRAMYMNFNFVLRNDFQNIAAFKSQIKFLSHARFVLTVVFSAGILGPLRAEFITGIAAMRPAAVRTLDLTLPVAETIAAAVRTR